jgi:hypothetical protein
MTLLTVVRDVFATVGVGGTVQPSSVFSGIAGNRTMQEMLALANEMAQRIAYDSRDWYRMRKTQVMNGNDLATGFDYPADYLRMLLQGEVYRSTNVLVPMRFIPDTMEWLNRRSRNINDAFGEWTSLNGQILIWPILATGQSAYYPYIHKNCVALGAGGVGDTFQADNDTFPLSERVLKLGMIWQWKAQKGSPYAEDLGTYGDALTSIMGRDGPQPTIIGRRVASQVQRGTAYPGLIPS